MTLLNLKPALLVSFSALAMLSGCATSLANRTPVDIASNSVRHTDPLSGVSEILGPRVKVFTDNGSAISGTAMLRTAGAFTDKNGRVFRDGTYLDIEINYTTPTPAPQETRGFDSANWAGGVESLLAEYGASVLDCRQDIRENYTPRYNYGYGYTDYRGGYNGGRRNNHDRDNDRDHGDDKDNGHGNTPNNPTTPPSTVTPTPSPTPALPDRFTPTPGERDLSLEPYRGGRGFRTGGIKPSPVRPQAISPPRPIKAEPRTVPSPPPKPRTPIKSQPSKPTATKPHWKTIQRTMDKELKYYPGDPYYEGGYRDVTVRYRCVRQESLRVFVPKDRLDDAEYRGLVLYLRPQVGREEAVFLPPNYIAGFKLAAYSPEGPEFTIQGEPIDLGKQAKPAPADKPIIYGQP